MCFEKLQKIHYQVLTETFLPFHLFSRVLGNFFWYIYLQNRLQFQNNHNVLVNKKSFCLRLADCKCSKINIFTRFVECKIILFANIYQSKLFSIIFLKIKPITHKLSNYVDFSFSFLWNKKDALQIEIFKRRKQNKLMFLNYSRIQKV